VEVAQKKAKARPDPDDDASAEEEDEEPRIPAKRKGSRPGGGRKKQKSKAVINSSDDEDVMVTEVQKKDAAGKGANEPRAVKDVKGKKRYVSVSPPGKYIAPPVIEFTSIDARRLPVTSPRSSQTPAPLQEFWRRAASTEALET
jgi:hypothetical protein